MARTRTCECVADHRPRPQSLDTHHVLPRSWGGLTRPSNIVTVCPNAHRDIHALLDEYVRLNATPSWAVRRHFSAFVRDLTERAWAQRPTNPTPTLLEHP